MSLLVIILTFAVLLFSTLVLKKSLILSSAVALLTAILINTIIGFSFSSVLPALLHGLITASEISLLIFGAISFFYFLKSGNFMAQLGQGVTNFSTNKLVVVILLVFFFGSFIEGISGFGTPAMIVAPLLLALRFPPYLAASLPLLANTVPVIFGAVGTPIKIGFSELPQDTLPVYASLLMLLPIIILPFLLKRSLIRSNLLKCTNANTKNYWLCLFAGISFALPFVLFSFFGPEFPTLLAAVIGLALWLFATSVIKPSESIISTTAILQFVNTFKPYLLIAFFLLAGKVLLQNAKISISLQEINFQKNIVLFQPGVFFLAGLFVLYFFSKTKSSINLKAIFGQTLSKLPIVFGTTTCLAILAKLLAQNLNITELLGTARTIPAIIFYPFAILTGLIGSFMAGSATVTNLLFGTQWYSIGINYELSVPLLLACQLAGAAIGNALSLQNVVMVQAVLNEQNLYKTVVSTIWKAILILVLLVSITAASIHILFQ